MFQVAFCFLLFLLGISGALFLLFEGFKRKDSITKIALYIGGFILLGEAYLIVEWAISMAKAKGIRSILEFVLLVSS